MNIPTGDVIWIVPAYESIPLPKHKRVSPGVIKESAKARVENAFDQHVDRFTRPAKPSLKHGEARLHPKHQKCRNEGPGSVDWIDRQTILGRIRQIGNRRH